VGLYKEGLITEETAMSYASKKAIVSRAVDAIKSARGEKTTTIENLSVDTGYGRKERH